MNKFITWLEERRSDVSRLEAEGEKCLGSGNMERYRGAMREKAEVLAALEDDGAALVSSLPSPWRSEAQRGLHSFSTSAGNALELDSVFYMSALLYPEEHRAGQPDDLDVFLARMRAGLEKI